MTLALPRLSAAEARHLNRLARRDRSLSVTFMGAAWSLRLRPCLGDGAADEAGRLAEPWYLTVAVGGQHAVLAVEAAAFGELLRSVDPGADPWDTPEPLLLALAELAATELAESLEAALGRDVRLAAVGPESPAAVGPHRFAIAIARADGTAVAEAVLSLDGRGLALLADIVERLPDREADDPGRWDALPVPLRLEVGWVDLPAAELAALARRDILLLDETAAVEEDRLVLRAAGGIALWARLERQTLIIEDIGRTMMREDPAVAAEEPSETEPLDSLDQIEVRLTFDIGQQTLTLAELRRLRPGASFDLGRDPRRAVHIRANGRLIGTGELVRIDDHVGVRVIALAGAAE